MNTEAFRAITAESCHCGGVEHSTDRHRPAEAYAELADLDRDTLTITTKRGLTWVTCTSGTDEVTVGPIPTGQITGALPAHHDDMDGGVTAALIEREVEERAGSYTRTDEDGLEVDYEAMWWKAEKERAAEVIRAEKAEGYRDQYRQDAIKAEQEREQYRRDVLNEDRISEWYAKRAKEARATIKEQAALIDALRAEHPRPLTPDDITDEMVTRLAEAARDEGYDAMMRIPVYVLTAALRAALTEPTRPGGAEEIQSRLFSTTTAVGIETTPEQRAALADHLASQGVRVTGAES